MYSQNANQTRIIGSILYATKFTRGQMADGGNAAVETIQFRNPRNFCNNLPSLPFTNPGMCRQTRNPLTTIQYSIFSMFVYPSLLLTQFAFHCWLCFHSHMFILNANIDFISLNWHKIALFFSNVISLPQLPMNISAMSSLLICW